MKKFERDSGLPPVFGGKTSESLYFSTFQPFPASVLVINTTVSTCFENGNIAIMDNLAPGYGLGSSELFVLRPTDIETNKEYLRGRAHNRYLPNEMAHVGTSIAPSYPLAWAFCPGQGAP